TLAELDSCGIDGRAADWLAVRKLGTDRLVAEPPHRDATATVKALIRRQREQGSALRGTHQRAQRDDAPSRRRPADGSQIDIRGGVALHDDEGGAGRPE